MPYLILIFSVFLLGSFSLGGVSALIPGFENNHISFLLPFLFCVFFFKGHFLLRIALLLCCGLMIVLYDLTVGGFSDFYSFSAACFLLILWILGRSSFYSAYQTRFFPSYLCFSFVLAAASLAQYFGASLVNNLTIPPSFIIHEAALNIVVFPVIYCLVKMVQNPEVENHGLE